MVIIIVGKHLSLITVATPFVMTFIKKLCGKTERQVGDAIVSQIDQVSAKGLRLEKLVWDSESSVKGENLDEKFS